MSGGRRPLPPGRTGRRRAVVPSALLLGLIALLAIFSDWVGTYPTMAVRSSILFRSAPSMTAEQRRMASYDETYPVLRFLRESTPSEAVILLPPEKFIDENTPGDIPLLASPSSVYNFIYPRVPVHWGDPSPWRERVTHLLVWKHWGLDLVAPGEAPGPENEIALRPWPPGRPPVW